MKGSRSSGLVVLGQLQRFALVGCLNVLVSFLVFQFFFVHWPLGSLLAEGFDAQMSGAPAAWIGAEANGALANLLGYTAGMLNSFILNKHWTFATKGDTALQAQRFIILNLAGMGLSTLAIFLFVDRAGLPYQWVWPLTTAVTMMLNFLGNRYWTFDEGRRTAGCG